MKKWFFLTLFLGLTLALAWQLSRQILPTTPKAITITVSAAISLKTALQTIQPLYQRQTPNIQIAYNFGGSGALQRQIEQGAPADIFISAAAKQMNALQAQNLILPATRHNLLTNQLVLIVPRNASGIQGFNQLTDPSVKRIAIGEPRSVPAGQYAQEVFQKLGIWEQIKPKSILANNVRQVLAAVASGNADAGVVYKTDTIGTPQVKVVTIADANLHSPIVYPIAVLKSSQQPLAAQAFIQYLVSQEARTVFEKDGFAIAK